MVKPFLKWVGGKTDLLDKILPLFPTEINNYHEVFVGGGSIFLNLLDNKNINITGKIYIYDSNEELINLYTCIKADYTKLWKHIYELSVEYINSEDKANYYYYIRELYNNSLIEKDAYFQSSLFLFLNKTCFRGLYRESNKGFNVPFGNYLKPSFIDLETLRKLNSEFSKIEIKYSSYQDTLNSIINYSKKGDFIYLDPPYASNKETDFVNYTKYGFPNDNHNVIYDKLLQLDKKGIKFLLSNSNIDFIKDLFVNYKINIISAKRRINSKLPNDKTTELLIYN
jgi:DNA adenine methylase